MLRKSSEEHKEGYTLCISHGMFISTLFTELHSLNLSQRYRYRILKLQNCAISMAVFHKKEPVNLVFFNATLP